MDPAPFDFDYRVREPGGALGRFVESLWFARGTVPYRRERIAPTGSTVAVIVLGDPIIEIADDGRGVPLETGRGFVIGPHDGPVINEPTGETYACGVVTTPVGCQAVMHIEPAAIRGQILELGDGWPAADALRPALLEANGPDAQLDLLEGRIRETLAPEVPGLERCERAIALLEAEPTRPIAAIAEALDVSHGHLVRELTRIVGLSPRKFARLIRMRRLLQALDVTGETDWAGRAADLGWFDQAHLIRDFKRHTGVTPTQYVSAQRSVFGPVSDADAAGFVPEF